MEVHYVPSTIANKVVYFLMLEYCNSFQTCFHSCLHACRHPRLLPMQQLLQTCFWPRHSCSSVSSIFKQIHDKNLILIMWPANPLPSVPNRISSIPSFTHSFLGAASSRVSWIQPAPVHLRWPCSAQQPLLHPEIYQRYFPGPPEHLSAFVFHCLLWCLYFSFQHTSLIIYIFANCSWFFVPFST